MRRLTIAAMFVFTTIACVACGTRNGFMPTTGPSSALSHRDATRYGYVVGGRALYVIDLSTNKVVKMFQRYDSARPIGDLPVLVTDLSTPYAYFSDYKWGYIAKLDTASGNKPTVVQKNLCGLSTGTIQGATRSAYFPGTCTLR